MQTSAAELHAQGPQLSVGLLGADPLNLGAGLAAIAAAGVRLVHIDVMDGVFSPVLVTAAPNLVAAVSDRFIADVHLMVADPLAAVMPYADAGAGAITFQVEATRHPHRVLQSLSGRGIVRGVAISPGTPFNVVEPLLDELEMVLLLSINPGGWGRQTFIPSTHRRLAELLRIVEGRGVVVAVDGAITAPLATQLTAEGADVIVCGRSIFTGDAAHNLKEMLAALSRTNEAQPIPTGRNR